MLHFLVMLKAVFPVLFSIDLVFNEYSFLLLKLVLDCNFLFLVVLPASFRSFIQQAFNLIASINDFRKSSVLLSAPFLLKKHTLVLIFPF